MVDSESSMSIVRKEMFDHSKGTTKVHPAPQLMAHNSLS